jgi:hypothetical protein
MFQKTKEGIIYIHNTVHEYNFQRREICFVMIYRANVVETKFTIMFIVDPNWTALGLIWQC